MLKEQILALLHGKIRQAMEYAEPDFQRLQEIRIRVGRPILLLENGQEHLIRENVSIRDIREIIDTACGYSGYAFEEEMKRGYLTIAGGHRIGVAGRAVMTEKGIQTMKYISALNIRIAHPVAGCAEKWMKYFYKENRPCHVLIISPPGCGKTTLLRDAIRMISDGDEKHAGATVGVIDERSEIAGTYRGVSNHNLGMRTDVLDGCPKALGVEMMLRSMSPKVLAMDEIGVGDVQTIENALRCGCKVLATLHGECLEDYIGKPGFLSLVREKVFERIVFLGIGKMPGKVRVIYGQNFEVLWEETECT